MGGFGGAGLAGCAEAGADALQVECDEEAFGVDAVDAEVGGIGHAGSVGGVDLSVGDGGAEALFEAIAKALHVGRAAGLEPGAGEGSGGAEAYDAGDVFGAGSALTLVGTAVEEGSEVGAGANEQGAGASGGVHFVAGEGEEVDVLELAGEVEGELAGGLDGVGVEEGAVGFGEAGELADGLDDAGFVVREHDADEAGVGLQGEVEVVGGDEAVAVGLEVGDVDAATLEGFGGMEHGVVFDGRGN